MPKTAAGKPSLSVAELPLEVARQRIDPDALDGLCVAMERVELTASLGIPEILPVGRFVASAGEARLLDEGFEQDRAIGVAGVPVFGQALRCQGENARGKVFAVNPGQDEEASIVDDEAQVASALLGGPADGVIARLGFPGARAEAERSDDVALGAHEVAELRARQGLMAEVVMVFDVGVPQQSTVIGPGCRKSRRRNTGAPFCGRVESGAAEDR